MRIVFATKFLSGIAGGAERSLIRLAGGMNARGHEVSIINYDKRPDPPYYPVPPDVPVVSLHPKAEAYARCVDPIADAAGRTKPDPGTVRPGPRRAKRWLRQIELKIPPLRRLTAAVRSRAVTDRVADYLAAERPDVVVAFLPHMAFEVSRAAARLPRIPSVLALRNTPEFDFAEPEDDPARAVKSRTVRDALHRFDRLTVLVPDYAELLPATLRSRTVCIPNDVPVADYARIQAIPLAERPRTIAFVGRLVDYKRPRSLIAAFASVASAHPGWNLVFYGEGPERPAMEADIKRHGLEDRVKLSGTTTSIGQAYAQAQIFCLPSLYEGFPRALSEAMASGLACLGHSDCVGVRHLLDGGAGRLVAPDLRSTGLGAALDDLMADGASRHALARAAIERIAQYRPEMVFDRWESLFSELTTQAVPGRFGSVRSGAVSRYRSQQSETG